MLRPNQTISEDAQCVNAFERIFIWYVLIGALVHSSRPAMPGETFADGYGKAPKRAASHASVVLELVPSQFEILRRLDPTCSAKLVGDAKASRTRWAF